MREFISSGTPNMPGFKYHFRPEQIDAIVAYPKTCRCPHRRHPRLPIQTGAEPSTIRRAGNGPATYATSSPPRRGVVPSASPSSLPRPTPPMVLLSGYDQSAAGEKMKA